MTSIIGHRAHIIIRWAALFVALIVMAGSLLQVANVKRVAADTGGYPWPDAPCATSGSNLGKTSGTGYWCSGYNWGESTCPTGDGYCTTGNKMNGYYLYDQWGESFRNCVSYTAYKLSTVFNVNPSNWGNGTDWNNSAIAAGYTDDTSPQVGDIAQWDATQQNQYGHVAYVYAVNNGVASYAEYNYAADGNFLNTYTSTTQGAPTHYIHIGTVAPTNPLRIGTVASDGTFSVKESTLSGSWHTESYGTTQGIVAGSLVGDVAGGVFQVKSGNLDGAWTTEEPSGAISASLSDASGSNLMRIGVLMNNGHFYVKEGGLTAGWTDEYAGVAAGYVSGSRIAVLTTSGSFLVKDGSLGASWVDVYDGVSQGILSGNLVGVVTTGGQFLVKQGDLATAPMVTEYYGVAAGILSDATSNTLLRIGVLDTSGMFQVKEGSLSASWTVEDYSVKQGILAGNLIGALYTNGNLSVKQGTLTQPWTPESYSSIAGVLWSL